MQKRFDWTLLAATILLVTLGLIILYAINFRDPGLAEKFNPTHQLMAAILGLLLLIVTSRIDYRFWFRAAPIWYIVSGFLLVLLLVVGETVAGSTRSIDLMFIQFQPTELAKLGLIFLLARWYTIRARELRHPWYVFFSLVAAGLIAGLIVAQPDIGSAVLIGGIWFVMTLASNVRKVYLAVLIVGVLLVSPFVIQQLQPYQQERLQTFFQPESGPRDGGYNVNQSTIAVGSGQIFGWGLGGGTQSQLNFLPSQHTDFIFAVIAEKLGLLGASLVIAVFAVLLFRGFYIALHAKDTFGSLLATGLTTLLLFHVVIAIGMNLGVAPVTGLPLPFISYGGTNLIISLLSVGILQSISIHKRGLEFKT
jgi:rod shape determining protein RodA